MTVDVCDHPVPYMLLERPCVISGTRDLASLQQKSWLILTGYCSLSPLLFHNPYLLSFRLNKCSWSWLARINLAYQAISQSSGLAKTIYCQ